MTSLQVGLLLIFGYIVVYSIVDRICKCFEQKELIKEYGKWAKDNVGKDEMEVDNGEEKKRTTYEE